MAAHRKAPAKPRAGWLTTACAALVLLTGCGSRDPSGFALAVIQAPGDTFNTGIDRPLAPQLSRASYAEGLVSFDSQGRVVPALADRWIVTDDGTSYIFRLRDGTWRDGDALTAKSAKTALDAAMRALRDTPLGLDLSVIEETRVMAGRVIEVRLHRPMPHFLQLLAQPELGLLHAKQGAGPMAMDRSKDVYRFTAIAPPRLGLPEVPQWEERVRPLQMYELAAEKAVALFNEGDVDLVLGGRIEDFPLTSSVGILRGTIQVDPAMGLFGLQIANDDGFLADPRNREALAMAIDRPGLMAPFGVEGWAPSTRLVSRGLEGDLETNGERWADMPLDERRARAAERVRRWVASNGKAGKEQEAPRLAIWLPLGPGSDILFERIAADLRAIGIAVERVDTVKAADLRLVDEVARYPRARWFLNRLSCTARKGLCDREVDSLVAEAVKVVDPVQRNTMLGEAEAKMTEANIFIPFGSPIRWSLVRGNVDGFAPNPWAWHPLMPLAWVRR